MDTISRQAALDIVYFECGEWSGLAKTIEKRFDELPSAVQTLYGYNIVHLALSLLYYRKKTYRRKN
jgi:hypothetical protein